jgi:gas vesicle protein
MADSGGGFITGFLFGGIVGAAFGLLLAPKPGQETRNELRNQSDIIRSKMEDIGTAARDRLGPAVDEIKDKIGPKLDEVIGNKNRSPARSDDELVLDDDFEEEFGLPKS